MIHFFSSIIKLPKRARYFSKIDELIYNVDLPLRVNAAHILKNENNIERLPEELRTAPNIVMLFEGAINLAQKIICANYRAAVPQYYNHEIGLLIPICLMSPNHVDLSLAIKRQEGYYEGKTCLTIDMAYNNARLIAFPNSDWLKTDYN